MILCLFACYFSTNWNILAILVEFFSKHLHLTYVSLTAGLNKSQPW